MSTLVLARKYRPRNFEALVGQQHVVQALANALTQQRLHHAYLFTGTRGVGKTTVSRILAKSLNCTGADGQGTITATPCGVCDACRDIDSGRFVDYVELDAASNRGVEEISQLLDQSVYKPVVGRFKVYMIDEVHMLSNTAFNAMLKTLEEPPEYLKFVLATTDPQKVPPTVLSRCLQFNLRPMAPATVQEHLLHVLEAESIAVEPGALRLLAKAARGSMRDALSLTDQAIAFGAGALSEAGVRQMLGAVDRGHAVRILDALSAGDGAGLVKSVDDLRGLGLSASGTLEELAALLQQMAVHLAVPDALDADDPEASTVARLAGQLAADEMQLCYSMCLHGRAELGLAPDEYSGLVMVLLRMLAFRPGASGTGGRPSSKEGGVSAVDSPRADMPTARASSQPQAVVTPPVSAPVPTAVGSNAALVSSRPVRLSTPVPQAAAPAAPPAVAAPVPRSTREDEPPAWLDEPAPWEEDTPSASSVRMDDDAPESRQASDPVVDVVLSAVAPRTPAFEPTALGERWAAVVAIMQSSGSISALVRELAMQAQCVALDEQAQPERWCLRVEREILRSASHVDKLQAALALARGHAVRLEVESGAAVDTPALRHQAEKIRRQQEAEALAAADPVVISMKSQFKTARIVPGSIQPLAG